MKTYECRCGNTLFFDNTTCVSCSARTVFCPACLVLTTLENFDGETGNCRHCQHPVRLCRNDTVHGVCNRGIDDSGDEREFCDFCKLNQTIPDLDIGDNLLLWRRLERAKQRVLHQIEVLGMPLRSESGPQLGFEFKADTPSQQVITGHLNGCITINIREADTVERERLRTQLGEPQRTLVGHIRHELGHFYWELLARPNSLAEFRELFGNEGELSYDAARANYYSNAPDPNWQKQFISAYASMHPWEDFAETFAAYLDIQAITHTASHFGILKTDAQCVDQLLDAYKVIGIIANELNRDMGLADLVPRVLNTTVVEKIRFIHGLCVGGNQC